MKTDIFKTEYAQNIFLNRYSMNGQESWENMCKRVVYNVAGQYLSSEDCNIIYEYMKQRKFIPAGRYLYASGRPFHMIKNCFSFRAKDTREGWGKLLQDIAITSMSGGGCGTDYSDLRESGALIKRTGGISSGPMALIHAVNETSRFIRQGGSRRAALLASLNWLHKDIFDFMHSKDWPEHLLVAKDIDYDTPLPLELTNISVNYDTDFFVAMKDTKHPLRKHARDVWNENCLQAFKTGEPGFCFNHLKDGENLRNPCGEFTTENNGDSCNLGTVFINFFDDREDFERCVEYATKFLLCGNLYSDYPTEDLREQALSNNKIGLGLGGLHEWMMVRGQPYGVSTELHKWLNIYERQSDESAFITARELGVTIPKSKRAIAPTGTISALSETTTGCEPLYCKAYKRKYYDNGVWKYQYVVDGTVKTLIEKGIDTNNIQDAYSISFKDRIKTQADLQQYVDMAISSTCNLPEWGSEANNENNVKEKSNILLRYAKRLRGFTCYPDKSRGGQPLEKVDIEEALKQEGKVFEFEEERQCKSGVCGI